MSNIMFPPEFNSEIVYPMFLDVKEQLLILRCNYTLPIGVSSLESIDRIQYVIKNIPSNKLVLSENLERIQNTQLFEKDGLIGEVKLTESQIELKIKISQDQYSTYFNLGQYYKIQFSFGGYYSSPLTIQCIYQPDTKIVLNKNKITGIIGMYSQSLQSSYFVIKDQEGKIVEKSSELICKEANKLEIDDSNQLEYYNQSFVLTKELEFLYPYRIEWYYTLKEGYQDCVTSVLSLSSIIIPDRIPFKIETELDRDNALINMFLRKENYNFQGKTLVLYKANSLNNFQSWKKIGEIPGQALNNYSPESKILLLKDLNVDFGEKYQYAIEIVETIQGEQEQIYKFKSEIIQVWFDDSYLFDGEKQLKIAFNPKVSSFKSQIKETKLEPIGSKYPIFYKNQIVNYKEFNISGLLSYLQDDQEDFVQNSQKIFRTNLSDENIYMEKVYKNKVHDWLINGKPKILKTPTEGIFNVKLSNVSLTPNDTLGRMLHTFQATAYEIEAQTENFGIVFNKLDSDNLGNKIITVSLNQNNSDWKIDQENQLAEKIKEIVISNVVVEGDGLRLRFIREGKVYNTLTVTSAGLHSANFLDEKVDTIKIEPIDNIDVKYSLDIVLIVESQRISTGNDINILKLELNGNLQPYIYNDNTNNLPSQGYYKTLILVAEPNVEGKFVYYDWLNEPHELNIFKQLTCNNIMLKYWDKDQSVGITDITGLYYARKEEQNDDE